MEKQQTAVEWLAGEMCVDWNHPYWKTILNQGKEMERQQIVDAFENGYENGACVSDEDPIYHGANYYNETFGK